MTVPLSALASVRDRTLFTDLGPIVKAPLPLLTGSNLSVIGPNQIQIPTASFDLSFVGKTVTISGTPEERRLAREKAAARAHSGANENARPPQTGRPPSDET